MNGPADPFYLDSLADLGEPIAPERCPRCRGDASAQNPRFVLVPFDKITLATAPPYRVKGLIPGVGLVVVWGAPKCGKSFFVFDLVMHVALGWDYRGRRVRQGQIATAPLREPKGSRPASRPSVERGLPKLRARFPFTLWRPL